MTSRERMLACFNGKLPDRMPFAPEINDHVVARLLDEASVVPPGEQKDAEPAWRYGQANRLIGADALSSIRAFSKVHPNCPEETWHEDDFSVHIIHTPKGDLVERSKFDATAQTTFRHEHLVKNVDDLAAYAAYLADAVVEPAPERYDEAVEALGDTGVASIYAPETPLMGLIMYSMGIQPSLFLALDHEQELLDFSRIAHEYNMKILKASCQCAGRIVRPFEDTSSSLTSPAMYEKFCLWCLEDYGRTCEEHGKQFVPHVCGLLRDMLPLMKGMPVHGAEAATPPPTGDAPATWIRKTMGEDFLIVGGIDATRAAILDPDAFDAHVRPVVEALWGDPRFILGCEEFGPAAKIENARHVAQIIAETAAARNG